MLKRLKSVSMLLFLMGASTGAAYAGANPGVADVKITQQNGACTGVVVDATGETVIGASVVVKGTTNGTITDFDGRFTLNVIPGTTLIISYFGYKTVEMKTVAGQPINLTLTEDSEMLEEVVVVGYGTMRKKDLTGSVVQINPSKIADQNPTSVQDVLRGTPGLQHRLKVVMLLFCYVDRIL